MSSGTAAAGEQKRDRFRAWIQFGVALLVIFLCVGQAVPGINESHYLPKAKHVWQPDFAPGDLFLESHDSHWLASIVAGWGAQWLPLTAVAWLGRLASWMLLAWGWGRLCRPLRIPPLLQPLALATWLLGVHYGHWAGEWVVGGFEAKALAYPCVCLGLAALLAGDWKWTWIWMGAAVAWHPLVGGWAGLSAGLVWLWEPQGMAARTAQWRWLLLGTALGLIGVVPAASGLGGPDVSDNISAAQVHVYLRLPHHLTPQLFAMQRHLAAACSLAALVFVSGLVWHSARQTARQPMSDARPAVAGQAARRLLSVAWIAVAFALVGLAIDLTLSTRRPDIAAKLLRFYWFRWADVVVPLAASLLFWQWLAMTPAAARILNRGLPIAADPAKSSGDVVGRGALALAVLLTLAALGGHLLANAQEDIPPADRLLVYSPGQHEPTSTNRYVDWLAVCNWIREHTPPDSLWLTPKYQQSFKWHAGRAEVYCWKDVPQDNAAVIEWYRRGLRCSPPRDSQGVVRDWTTDELLALSRDYGFRWVLIDRSFQLHPPALELLYPLAQDGFYIDNRSFAVFRIPQGMLNDRSPGSEPDLPQEKVAP